MKKTKNNLLWYALGGLAVFVVIVIAVAMSGSQPALASGAVLHKSSNCGCCGIYASYADNKLDMEVRNSDAVSLIKDEYNIPAQLRSCHTTTVEGYFVEGHVPMEAIEKLLTEKPDIAGIALPGMPSGTPGMPGPKTESWVIYAVGHDGEISEFLTV